MAKRGVAGRAGAAAAGGAGAKGGRGEAGWNRERSRAIDREARRMMQTAAGGLGRIAQATTRGAAGRR